MRHTIPQNKSDKTDEYSKFEDSLKQILSVSHSEMKSRIESGKQKKSKRRHASRVSRDSD
jgi:hypothetical protein